MTDEVKPEVPAHLSLADKVEAVLKRYEHDMIGKVHFVYDEIKTVLADVRAAV